MSAIANVSGELIQQSNNVAASSSWTAMCWFRVLSTPGVGEYRTVFTRINAGYTAWSGIFCDAGTNDFRISTDDGAGTNAFTSAQTLTVNQWIHLGYVKSGNTHRFYVNGVLFSQTTLNINAVVFTDLYALGDTFDDPNVEIAFFREWNDVLSTPDVVLEMNSTIPIQTSNLITDTPLASDLLDDSGNSNNWTATGAITFGTSIAIPANASSAGAVDILGLPFTANQNLVVDGFAFDGWFKHTGTGSYNLGIWGFGNLVDFSSNVQVFDADSVTAFPSVGPIDADNIPLQVPFVAAQVRYFKYTPNNRTLSVANLTVNAQESPNESVPLGSIFVPDDHDEGFKLGAFSAIDGDDYHVLKFIDFVSCESGDILDNGFVLVGDKSDNSLKGYNASFVLQFTISSRTLASTFGCIRQCRGTQRWWILYLSGGTQFVARFVTDAGVEGTAHNVATLASAEDPYCLAVNNDESILYYGEATAGSDTIKQFNLATDTLIGTFAAAPGANYKVTDILVLSDDTIVAYWGSISDNNIQVIQYNAAGTILETIDLGTGFVFPSLVRGRMAYSLDDPDSVWVMLHPGADHIGETKFIEIELATGTFLKEIFQQEYEIGEYNSPVNASPERFGNSFSCPFWVATTGAAPPDTGTLTVAKLSDPFSGAHIFTVDVLSGLSPAVLSLVSDDPGHTYDPVPVGIYSVVERPDPDWDPVYFVSNDVNNDNLHVSVGVGEDVTVIVLNTFSSPGGGPFELFPPAPNEPDIPTDDFPNGDGTVTKRGIPPPFIITGFIRDA